MYSLSRVGRSCFLWHVLFYFKECKSRTRRLRLGAKAWPRWKWHLKGESLHRGPVPGHKDEARNRTKNSFNCLEDTEAESLQRRQKGHKGLKTLRKTEDRNGLITLDCNNKLQAKGRRAAWFSNDQERFQKSYRLSKYGAEGNKMTCPTRYFFNICVQCLKPNCILC